MSDKKITLPASGKMKDFFDAAIVEDIAQRLNSTHSAFDAQAFGAKVIPKLDGLEYSGRLSLISETIADALPARFSACIRILMDALGPEPTTEFGEFRHLPLLQVIPLRGLAYREEAVNALLDMTRWFSAEFAIRPFLDREPAQTLAQFLNAATHPSPKVRRLLSEGSRPRLPWGIRLKKFVKDPNPLLPILSALRNDPNEAVRRSVANSLNDIAKDHPTLVVETLNAWRDETPSKNLERLSAHALRHLIKDGHPKALAHLGFTENPEYRVEQLTLSSKQITVGETLNFYFMLHSTASRDQKLVLDFAIHYVKAKGDRAPKVFKLSNVTLSPGETRRFEKSASFKPVTTRKLYPGRHAVEILVNGASAALEEFDLRGA